jgi:nitroreductase
MADGFIDLDYSEYPAEVMQERASAFYDEVRRRRTVRDFSDRAVPREVIEACIASAGMAPSGANQQPWHFVAVSDPSIKHQIRTAAEEEERAFYGGRASEEWLSALEPLGTDAQKPFLESAAWLIAIFGESYGVSEDGSQVKHYYVQESVGIATGVLITALHYAGLATLTHTPSPMGFLNSILGRPSNERPFLLLVAGYPAMGAQVPDIARKDLGGIASFI